MKHPHKLLLQEHRTWRCVIENCSFFVHLGLAHVLLGKHSICWKCEEAFVIDAISLKNPKPICLDCRELELGQQSTRTPEIPNKPSNQSVELDKPVEEMNEAKKKIYRELGLIK